MSLRSARITSENREFLALVRAAFSTFERTQFVSLHLLRLELFMVQFSNEQRDMVLPTPSVELVLAEGALHVMVDDPRYEEALELG